MQKTAYEMRISDWSSDVCSSDLGSRYREGRTSDGRLESRTTAAWFVADPEILDIAQIGICDVAACRRAARLLHRWRPVRRLVETARSRNLADMTGDPVVDVLAGGRRRGDTVDGEIGRAHV